jgi:hypothetical protein
LLDNVTDVPPDGAAALMFTVQFEVAGPVTVPGTQLNPVTWSAGDTVKPVVAVPFNEADSVAFTVVAVELAVAVKPALDCPAATVTLGGTVTVALLLDSVTDVPPDGAAALMFTVQLEVAGPVTVPGTQLKPVTWSAGVTVNPVVAVLPFNEAESVAFTVVEVEPAVAVKPAVD